MNFWKTLFHWNHDSGIAGSVSKAESGEITEINPATGLPMIGNDSGGIDIGGNPYGTDLYSLDEPEICTHMGLEEDIFGGEGF